MVHNEIRVIPEGIASIRFTLKHPKETLPGFLMLLSKHPLAPIIQAISKKHGTPAFLTTAVAAATITVAFPGALSAFTVVATLQTCQTKNPSMGGCFTCVFLQKNGEVKNTKMLLK